MSKTRISIDIDIDHDDYIDLEDTKEEILQSINGKKCVDWVQLTSEVEIED